MNGKAYPAELHLVHESVKGELAVVGAFIEEGTTDNPAFEALISRVPKVAGDGVEVTSEQDIAAIGNSARPVQPVYARR